MAFIGLASQTTFAELLQRCLDAEIDEEFSEDGYFKKRRRERRYYWYFRSAGRQKSERYVGPVTDKSISDRVKRFADLKSDFRERQSLVRGLVASGLPEPDPLSGRIVEAMWRAGFFRLRGVLVGTLAFQCYVGVLGLDVRGRPLQTQDADFAQFWGISQNIGESMPPILDVLCSVDATFSPVPHLDDPLVSVRYRNAQRYAVDLLVPNRGSDEHQGRPARMKALGGAGAQPLRHLDFLIHLPERSVLLHKAGVPVTVPRAERFAVHKLIVAASRTDQLKSSKDVQQAETLLAALRRQRPLELADAWREAWETGPRWREKMDAGRERLSDDGRAAIDDVLARSKIRRSGRRNR